MLQHMTSRIHSSTWCGSSRNGSLTKNGSMCLARTVVRSLTQWQPLILCSLIQQNPLNAPTKPLSARKALLAGTVLVLFDKAFKQLFNFVVCSLYIVGLSCELANYEQGSLFATMILVVFFWMAIAQPLYQDQYNALMDVYSDLGSSSLFLCAHTPVLKMIFFCFFFFAGCDSTKCPRFSSSSLCVSPATCSNGHVIQLCVKTLVPKLPLLTFLSVAFGHHSLTVD
jgi:hypothetical protein